MKTPWWDYEVGQCRGCGMSLHEEHAPGCREALDARIDAALEHHNAPRPKVRLTADPCEGLFDFAAELSRIARDGQ